MTAHSRLPFRLNEDGTTIYSGGDCVAVCGPVDDLRNALATFGAHKDYGTFSKYRSANCPALLDGDDACTCGWTAMKAVLAKPSPLAFPVPAIQRENAALIVLRANASDDFVEAARIAIAELEAVEREIGVPSRGLPLLRAAIAKAAP